MLKRILIGLALLLAVIPRIQAQNVLSSDKYYVGFGAGPYLLENETVEGVNTAVFFGNKLIGTSYGNNRFGFVFAETMLRLIAYENPDTKRSHNLSGFGLAVVNQFDTEDISFFLRNGILVQSVAIENDDTKTGFQLYNELGFSVKSIQHMRLETDFNSRILRIGFYLPL